jgi:hypothetical protein
VVNEAGRKLVSFCKTLNLEMVNGRREGDVTRKIIFIAQMDKNVIRVHYVHIRLENV